MSEGRSKSPPTQLESPDELRARVAQLEDSIQGLQSRLSAYDQIFLQNPSPAMVYDPASLRIQEANDGVLALYSYTREELCGLTLLDLFGPMSVKDHEEVRLELSRAVVTLGPLMHRTATRRELFVRMVIFPFDRNGRGSRIVLIQDETRRRLAEDALRASEERYRDLFENANDVIFLQDLKGRLLAVNRAAEYLTGYSRNEILGQDFSILIAPQAHEQIQDSIRAHLGGSPTQRFELPVISKIGTRRALEVSTRIIYRGGHPVAIQGIGRDVTERKLSQQRLIESSRELQLKNEALSTALALAREATQLKEQFLANTSHELRTPMNGIMGMVNLLKDTPLVPEQREYVEAINGCADDLLIIINDLLDSSQIEAGHLSLNEEFFDPHESLKSVVKMLSVKAQSKGLFLTHELDPALPKAVFGDCVRFRQILTNLIANAVKFTSVGRVAVWMGLNETSDALYCEVVDSGIGVDESIRERIFEAFFQADGTMSRRFGGTGLGLTVCKQLVDIMGGRIGTRDNGTDPGATFWFELPLRTGTEPVVPQQCSVG
ncbi:MAG: sensor histidine kinase [Bryobacterales bacterium]|nr:sensor histidine kinase [Bryobacterales bacterium]